MNTRFGGLKLKQKLSNRLCERGCGHRGRFRTRAASSPWAFQASRRQSRAFVSSGGFWGRRSTRTKTGSFWDLGMPSTSRILDVFHSGKLRFSARSKASCLFFQLLYGQLRLEKSVLGGKAWTNRKILVYQTRKLWSSARSEASCLFF